MNLSAITFLYQYNAWANGRVLDTAAHLNASQLLAQPLSSAPSVRDMLVHTMSAQEIWLSRWRGISPGKLADPSAFNTLVDVRTHWDKIEAETQRFLGGLSEERLQQNLVYKNTRGTSFSDPLWQQMIHQVNHATQHRSESAMLLTEMGYSPGELDVIRYVRLGE